MSLEVGPLIEAATADRTLVWRLFEVQDLVHGQRPRLTEPFAAFSALERLLLGMDIPETYKKLCFINVLNSSDDEEEEDDNNNNNLPPKLFRI